METEDFTTFLSSPNTRLSVRSLNYAVAMCENEILREVVFRHGNDLPIYSRNMTKSKLEEIIIQGKNNLDFYDIISNHNFYPQKLLEIKNKKRLLSKIVAQNLYSLLLMNYIALGSYPIICNSDVEYMFWLVNNIKSGKIRQEDIRFKNHCCYSTFLKLSKLIEVNLHLVDVPEKPENYDVDMMKSKNGSFSEDDLYYYHSKYIENELIYDWMLPILNAMSSVGIYVPTQHPLYQFHFSTNRTYEKLLESLNKFNENDKYERDCKLVSAFMNELISEQTLFELSDPNLYIWLINYQNI